MGKTTVHYFEDILQIPDRISALKEHPDYWEHALAVQSVKVDGVEYDGVFFADRVEGYVLQWHHRLDENGIQVYQEEDGKDVIRRIDGAVEIVMPSIDG